MKVARRFREDILAAGGDDDHNKRNRHAASRQFFSWIHEYLGAGNRRVIPSCVWKIRGQCPDSFRSSWLIKVNDKKYMRN